jgi:hypothetical protein
MGKLGEILSHPDEILPLVRRRFVALRERGARAEKEEESGAASPLTHPRPRASLFIISA